MNWRFGEMGWRLLPGTIATILMAGLLNLGLIKPLEQVAYSTLFHLRGERKWDDRLVLVTIDDASIKQLGRFPWARTRYVQLIDRLTQADASVIAIDLLFSESSPDDAALTKAIARSNRVVLAQGERGLPLLPIPEFQNVAVGIGQIRIQADEDGITRSIEPLVKGSLAFGIATAMTHSMLREAIEQPDLTQRLWLNWAGRADQISQYSFASVIRGEVPDSAFRHKIVVVGVTASATDAAATPFDRNPPANGVHLQATLIDNVLQRNALTPIAGTGMTILIFAIGGIGFSVLLSFWRTEIQIAIAAFAIFIWIGSDVTLLKMNYLPPVILPIGLIISGTIAATLTERSRMNMMLQQQIDQLQQRYEPDLVTRLIDDSDQIPASASLQQVSQLTTLVNQLGRLQTTQAAITQTLSIGLVACNLDGQVWFCNSIAAALLNLEVGSRAETAFVPEWLSLAEWQRILASSQAISTEKLHQKQWFCLQIEPLKDQIDGVLIVLEEITIRKSIELSLDEEIRELQQLSELKNEFLSTVSHELRTPLTNMKVAVQLLKMARTDTQKEHYLRILEIECNREADLINTLLDLQCIESGRQSFDIQPIDLHTWLPELLEPFDQRTESRQQSFTLVIDPEVPELYSDRASLERILVELINNACKYTPLNEHIIVSAEWNPPCVELDVKNSGVEISAEARSRIFDRFYRVPNADPWEQGGSGLGLALVKILVELLQGTIKVKSENNWTIFNVKFSIRPMNSRDSHSPQL